jgi:hypothetical protein
VQLLLHESTEDHGAKRSERSPAVSGFTWLGGAPKGVGVQCEGRRVAPRSAGGNHSIGDGGNKNDCSGAHGRYSLVTS